MMNNKTERSYKPSLCCRSLFFVALTIVFGVFVLALPSFLFAEITSRNHRTLKRSLKKHPAADTNKDGILTFTEYQAFRKTNPPKQPNGTLLANGDLLITDFDINNFGQMKQWGWTIEGSAFAQNLDQMTRAMKRRAVTHSGKFLLSTFAGSDATTGRMVSPEFAIELKHIQFKLSGGNYPHRVCINLIVDDKVLRTATGRNDDRFEWVAFDVSGLQDRKARLEIVDDHAGIWGHINVDRIVQTDRPSARRIIAKAPIDYGKVVGTVLAKDRRLRGPLMLKNGRLSVGRNQEIQVNDLLLAFCENETSLVNSISGLRLIDGQMWYGKLLELKDGKVGILSDMFQRRDVPLQQIASIVFKPGKGSGDKPGTLYRDKGEPIPGKLVWIREKDVAIDCALGVVPVPRNTIRRFVLAKVQPPVDLTQDEIALVDGNLLRGRLSAADDQLYVKHDTLGQLTLKWAQVRSVRRAAQGVMWFDRLEGKVIERVGPVLPPPPPSVIDGFGPKPDYLRAVRMMPKTVTQYKLPTGPHNRQLRGTLAPVSGCRADVNVRIKDGKKVLWEKHIAASSDPMELAVQLQKATTFTIEVDFGDRIAFPCGVDWRDAYVLAKI